MKMDEENRKKLQRFWRKRLLLGLGLVGVLGLGAWRFVALQERYDELLIMESRDLAEGYYQAQVKTIRETMSQPLPPVPENPVQRNNFGQASTKPLPACKSIWRLGDFQDKRAIAELGKILNDDLAHARSCSLAEDERSFYFDNTGTVYTVAVQTLGKFSDRVASNYLKAEIGKTPSKEVITLQRRLLRQSILASGDSSVLGKIDSVVDNRISGEFLESQERILGGVGYYVLPQEEMKAISTRVWHDISQQGRTIADQPADQRKVLEQIQIASRVVVLKSWSAALSKEEAQTILVPALLEFSEIAPQETVNQLIAEILRRQPDVRSALENRNQKIDQALKQVPDPSQAKKPESIESIQTKTPESIESIQNRLETEVLGLNEKLTSESQENRLRDERRRLAYAGINPSLAAFWTKEEKTKALPILRDRIKRMTQQGKSPCLEASWLAYLGNNEGVQPCIAYFKAQNEKINAFEDPFKDNNFGSDVYASSRFPIGGSITTSMQEILNNLGLTSETYYGQFNPLFIEFLKDSDLEVRRFAIFMIAQSPAASEYTTAIASALNDSDEGVRIFAAKYFPLINDSSSSISDSYSSSRSLSFNAQTINALIQATRDPNSIVRFNAVAMLPKIRSEASTNAIINALKDDVREVREVAKRYFTNDDLRDNQAVKANLLQTLHHPNPGTRSDTLSILCSVSDSTFLPQLLQSMQDQSDEVKNAAVSCINTWIEQGKGDERQIAPALISAIQAVSFTDRIASITCLYKDSTMRLIAQRVCQSVPQLSQSLSYKASIPYALTTLMKQDRLNLSAAELKKAIPTLMSTDRHTPDGVRLIDHLSKQLPPPDKAAENRTYFFWHLERSILATIGLTTIVLLLSSIRLRNPFPLIFSGYLIFPEEIIAELIALKQRRQAAGVKPRRIRLELAYEILLLLWAVHIQMRVDNINLPPGGNDRAK
jgi:hypothetical protein